MNAEQLAKEYHETVRLVSEQKKFPTVTSQWEELSETTRDTMTAVAQVIIDKYFGPILGTDEKPKATLSIEETGDTELNTVLFLLAALQSYTYNNQIGILDYVRDRINRENMSSLSMEMRTNTPATEDQAQ